MRHEGVMALGRGVFWLMVLLLPPSAPRTTVLQDIITIEHRDHLPLSRQREGNGIICFGRRRRRICCSRRRMGLLMGSMARRIGGVCLQPLFEGGNCMGFRNRRIVKFTTNREAQDTAFPPKVVINKAMASQFLRVPQARISA